MFLIYSRVGSRERALGQEASDWELGVVTGQIRRALFLDFVRAQDLCLLSRLCHLGDGAVARREQADREEEARRNEQTAHYLAGEGSEKGWGNICLNCGCFTWYYPVISHM